MWIHKVLFFFFTERPNSNPGDGLIEKSVGNQELLALLIHSNIPVSTINNILGLLRKYTHPQDIHKLPADYRSVVGPYDLPEVQYIDEDNEDEDNVDEDNLEEGNRSNSNKMSNFRYFGIKHAIKKGWATFDSSNDDLFLSINVDGAPLFKSSTQVFWPILGCFERHSVFLLALYYGRSKPKYAHSYMADFVQEFIQLQQAGIFIENKKYSLHLRGTHFDSPARSLILCTHYHNSQDGCHKCKVRGTYFKNMHRMAFLSVDAEPRTREDFLVRVSDHPDISKLLEIPGFDPVKHSPLDSMHVVDLGVMRKMWYYWNSRMKNIGDIALRPVERSILNERLLNLTAYCPREFSRKPRGTKDSSFYKAKEYRQLLLYTGPIILQGLLEKKKYDHFIHFHVAIRLLDNPVHTVDLSTVEYAEQLLKNFVADFPSIYREDLVSYNVHSLIHLAEDVRNYGFLSSYSSYYFESYLGQLNSLVHSGNLPATQVARRLHDKHTLKLFGSSTSSKTPHLRIVMKQTIDYESLPQLIDCILYSSLTHNDYFFNSSSINNKYCQVNDEIILEIKYFAKQKTNGNIYICGHKMKQVAPLYVSPCSSYYVDLFEAKLDDDKNLFVFNLEDLTGKFYPMPRENGNVALAKLLHCEFIKQ